MKQRKRFYPEICNRKYSMVVVGCSVGGTQTVRRILSKMDSDFPLPIAIAQHRSAEAFSPFINEFSNGSPLEVREAEDKDAIRPSCIYIAPADYHLLVERNNFALSTEGRVSFARPSIDVLFASAAEAFGPQLIGVVLTGANSDGVTGAMTIKQHGGTLLVQDPTTATSSVLPNGVLREVGAEYILGPEELGTLLSELGACSSDE